MSSCSIMVSRPCFWIVTNHTAYGGSWADDEIDIASISVPIQANRGHTGDALYGSGSSRSGSTRGSSYLDNGPPYIVKLSNLPVNSNDAFISDLFRSRFTPMVKFKILFDPFSQPLELGIIKKIAFVELPTFASQNKVAKWQDVIYKGSRRVLIEVADFNDFQQSMRFNQEHHQELLKVEQAFFSKPRHGHMDDNTHGRKPGFGRAAGGMPLDSAPLPGKQHHFGPKLQTRRLSNEDSRLSNLTAGEGATSETAHEGPIKPKPNPFGSAKPVDVLARQHEIEKNLIVKQHTIMRAPWADDPKAAPDTPKRLPNSWVHDTELNPHAANGPKKSLADILGRSKVKGQTKNPRAASSNLPPKAVAKKPTVLMKKPATSTPEPQSKEQVSTDGKANESQPEASPSSQDHTLQENSVNLGPSDTDAFERIAHQAQKPISTDDEVRPNARKSERRGSHLSSLKPSVGSERKRGGPRRRTELGVISNNDQKSEPRPSSQPRSERQKGPRKKERSTGSGDVAQGPVHESEEKGKSKCESLKTPESLRNKREPRARRQSRKHLLEDTKPGLEQSGTKAELRRTTQGEGSKSADFLPSDDSSRETDSKGTGARRERGRRNGSGRGNIRAGNGGPERSKRGGIEKKE